jgi:hypothetical protein
MTTPPETPRPSYGMPNMPMNARLPIPGNAEFLLYVVALLVAAIVCGISDRLGSGDWFGFFQLTTVAYILSRGIAKASRVLEQ